MREIGFDHQHCTFHLLLNINEELREELKQIRKEYESNLKKQNLTAQKFTVLKSKDQPIRSMGLVGPVTMYIHS